MSRKNKGKPPAPATPGKAVEQAPAAPAAPPAKKPAWWFVLALFALALTLRLLFLGRAEVWGDEVLFVQTSDISGGPGAVIKLYWERTIVAMAWLPAPAVVQNICLRALAPYVDRIMFHPFWVRLPGSLFGALGVLAVYGLARRCAGEKLGRLAGLMMCVFLFPVYYSREAHAYPMLLCMSGYAALLWLTSLFSDRPKTAALAALLAVSVALVYTHLSGAFLVGTFFALGVGCRLLTRQGKPDVCRPSSALATAAVCALALLAIAPVFYRVLFGGNPHMAEASVLSPLTIVNDGLVKMFLGDAPWAAAAAWFLLAAGCVYLWRTAPRRNEAHALVLATVLGFALIAYAAKRTQYLSPRYFAAVAPMLFVCFAAGLAQAARLLASVLPGRGALEGRVLVALAAVPLLIHACVYLPAMYQLRAKMAPYGQLADWLNRDLPPGAPYTFDCGGWDLRYVPGYYPTPQHQPVVQVAWNGADYAPAVQSIQQRMMDLFPVSAYIESLDNPWDVPRRFYRHKAEFRNEPLARLLRMGTWFGFSTQGGTENYRNIWYNTEADAVQIARQKGEPVFIRYPGWVCAQTAREHYVRIAQRSAAELLITNLVDAPVRGTLRFRGGALASSGSYSITFYWRDGQAATYTAAASPIWERYSAATWDVKLAGIEAPPGESALRWHIRPNAPAGQVGTYFIEETSFSPEPAAPPT
ncbi:MAG: glycosyltransferase family 39 protein [Verrucomicrobiota bacterium]